jgi:hypothetical protein
MGMNSGDHAQIANGPRLARTEKGNEPMSNQRPTQDEIDQKLEDFHNAAGAVLEALKFAHSMKSEGNTIEAFGKAVTLARQWVHTEEVLNLIDEGFASYGEQTKGARR